MTEHRIRRYRNAGTMGPDYGFVEVKARDTGTVGLWAAAGASTLGIELSAEQVRDLAEQLSAFVARTQPAPSTRHLIEGEDFG